MTTWWWVRHAPTDEESLVGWRDMAADLSDSDLIDRLSAYLPADGVVVSSDLRRAVITADAIEIGRQRLAHAAELREFNFGDWDGLTFAQVAARHPDLSRAYWEAPGDAAPPNGESWNDVAARVAPFVDAMNVRFAGRNIIAVAHIGVIMTQIQRAGNLSAAKAITHKIDNFSVTSLHWHSDGWHIGAINHIP
ncbi:MAG: histidine phosphatase family protein [Paracoccaceae bacterium]